MFAKVSVGWKDDLVGDSMRRFLRGLSWDGVKEIVRRGGCPSHLMERQRGTGARVIRLCLCTCSHTHTCAHIYANIRADWSSRLNALRVV